MEPVAEINQLLNVTVNLSAAPEVSFGKESPFFAPPPNNASRFEIYITTEVKLNGLSEVATQYLKNKRIQLSQGLFNKHIVIENCTLQGLGNEQLFIKAQFSGSFKGTFYLAGTPYYNAATQTIEVKQVDYRLETSDWLLKAAKWLFNKQITHELNKRTSFPVSDLYTAITQKLQPVLNKEWTKGVESSGEIADLRLTEIHTLKEAILLQCFCKGQLSLAIQL